MDNELIKVYGHMVIEGVLGCTNGHVICINKNRVKTELEYNFVLGHELGHVYDKINDPSKPYDQVVEAFAEAYTCYYNKVSVKKYLKLQKEGLIQKSYVSNNFEIRFYAKLFRFLLKFKFWRENMLDESRPYKVDYDY